MLLLCTDITEEEGPNQLLGEPLWTVIDRMPVALDSVKQIHEVSDKGGLAELCSDDFTSS